MIYLRRENLSKIAVLLCFLLIIVIGRNDLPRGDSNSPTTSGYPEAIQSGIAFDGSPIENSSEQRIHVLSYPIPVPVSQQNDQYGIRNKISAILKNNTVLRELLVTGILVINLGTRELIFPFNSFW
jgi:hypothetical protein